MALLAALVAAPVPAHAGEALTSSSGSKFYDYVPGLEWEAKSVYSDIPAFTRVRVSDDSLRATTYEVPAGTVGQPAARAASEEIDDVEITRPADETAGPGDNADGAEDGRDADGADLPRGGISSGRSLPGPVHGEVLRVRRTP